MRSSHCFLKIFLALFGVAATIQNGVCGQNAIQVVNPWARETPPGAENGAVYLQILNLRETDAWLTSVHSSVAENAELHTHVHQKGVVKMRSVERVVVPGKGNAELKPGGDHVMLLGINAPLMAGDLIILELRFLDGTTIPVDVPVKGFGMTAPDHPSQDKKNGESH